MGFYNQTFWLTGASSGIGRAVAKNLIENDSKVILSGRDVRALQELMAQFPEKKNNIQIVKVDLNQLSDLSEVTKTAWNCFGEINTYIGCAGVGQRSYVIDTELIVYEKLLEINFLSHVVITKALLPMMLKNKNGHLVYVSSVMGEFGLRTRGAYSASKHALHGYVDALRAEIEGSIIRITLTCPGYTKTATAHNALNAAGQAYGMEDKNTAKGMEAIDCANRIIRAIKKKKAQSYPALISNVFPVIVKRYFPSLFDFLMKRIRLDIEKELMKPKKNR